MDSIIKMKKKCLALLLFSLVTQNAFAEMMGWYATAEVGHTSNDYSADNQGFVLYQGTQTLGAATPESKNGQQNSARIDIGYGFNDYLSGEFGFAWYGDVKFNNIYGYPGATVKYKLTAADLVAIAKFPIGNQFHLFAELGAALATIKETVNFTANNIPLPGGGTAVIQDNTQRKVRPTYGIGAAFDLNNIFAISLQWTRIPGSNQIENMDFASVGLVYHFDEYLR